MSPHVSGRSELTTRRRWEFVAAQLVRLDRGEPLENVLVVA
jgi:phosphoglycerate dehydrogenase-like enzyme